MEELRGMALASSVTDQAPEAPMREEQVVEDVLARLRRGTAVLALAREYGVDPKTIRAWRQRGGYRPRELRPAPQAGAPRSLSNITRAHGRHAHRSPRTAQSPFSAAVDTQRPTCAVRRARL